MYTALTRAKRRLYILLHERLRDKFNEVISEILDNSEVDRRTTLLFGFTGYASKFYVSESESGNVYYLRSKIEYMIANAGIIDPATLNIP